MRVLGVGVAVVLLSLIFLGTATGESKPISENDLSQAIAFRTQFGLDADPSFAQTVASNPEASSALGIPLLPEEIADLDARDAAVAAIGPLIGLLEADPTYAGIYVDQSKGGRFVVSTTGSGKAAAAAIASALPKGATAQIVNVAHSMADLKAAMDRVTAEDAGLSHRAGLSAEWIDPKANRVHIGIDPFNEDVANGLALEFGNLVDVSYVARESNLACNSRHDCGDPPKGGIEIDHNNSPTDAVACTSGFPAGKISGAIANHWYMLTAGHCLYFGDGIGRSWMHHAISFGVSRAFSYCDGCSSDSGIIEMNVWDTPTNLVMAGGVNDQRGITSIRHNSEQVLGAGACRAGQKSDNYVCGQIDRVDARIQTIGRDGIARWQPHSWHLNVSSQEGDSGGPIMYGTAAMGLVMSGTTSYSTLDWAAADLGYKPCITEYFNPCHLP
jgi:hypothetical protein